MTNPFQRLSFSATFKGVAAGRAVSATLGLPALRRSVAPAPALVALALESVSGTLAFVFALATLNAPFLSFFSIINKNNHNKCSNHASINSKFFSNC